MGAPKGVPHVKPSKEEKAKQQQYVYELLQKGVLAGEVKRLVSSSSGCSPRTVEAYISRARAKMREESGRDDDEHRSDAFHFYNSILTDKDASHRDKIRARERIDKLLGLDKPVIVHGKNVNVDITPEQLAEMSDDELASLESRLLN